METKNQLIASHRFGRFATITMSEWSNGSFSISKSVLKDKNKGWKDKDNIERIVLLNFYYNELFQVLEVLNAKKTIGNFEFKTEKVGDYGVLKVIIIKHFKNKEGQGDSKRYEMSINEYYIIKSLIRRVIEADCELYTPQHKNSNDTTSNPNFDELPVSEEDIMNVEDVMPF